MSSKTCKRSQTLERTELNRPERGSLELHEIDAHPAKKPRRSQNLPGHHRSAQPVAVQTNEKKSVTQITKYPRRRSC